MLIWGEISILKIILFSRLHSAEQLDAAHQYIDNYYIQLTSVSGCYHHFLVAPIYHSQIMIIIVCNLTCVCDLL